MEVEDKEPAHKMTERIRVKHMRERGEEKLYTEEKGIPLRIPTRKQRYSVKPSKVIPKKVGVGLKRRLELNKKRL